MLRIPVKACRPSPTFSSFEASVRHGLNFPPLARAKRDAQLLADSQIIDGFWTDADWVIRFSNGRFLHVEIAPRNAVVAVEWRIVESEPRLPGAEVWRVGCEPVLLDFEKVGAYAKSAPFVMDRSAMMAARRGKPFKDLFVNELGFYVYTPRQLILCFGCVARRDTGEDMLYVYEDD